MLTSKTGSTSKFNLVSFLIFLFIYVMYFYWLLFRFVAWFTFRMVSLLATSLVVQPNQINRVKDAEKSGLPVIYLPLHKSHMDYILLGLVLTMHNIKPPLVAAGENLRIFFIKYEIMTNIFTIINFNNNEMVLI